MRLIQTSQPSIEPLLLADAKLAAYVDITATDSLINALINVARVWVEQYCNRALITQNWTVYYDYHDKMYGYWVNKRKIAIPKSIVQSITAITTYDQFRNALVFDSSNYFQTGDYIALQDTFDWPTELGLYDCLQIDFVAGYGNSASNVPNGIIQAMKMLVATWYENREAITDDVLAKVNMQALPMPFGVTALLAPYRVFAL
jgi:uncharacterized phiE125 gp8 family phage protein